MVVGFFAAILGSAGTGLFVLILGAAAFVVRAGLEDFVRSRQGARRTGRRRRAEAEPEFTVYRARVTPPAANEVCCLIRCL